MAWTKVDENSLEQIALGDHDSYWPNEQAAHRDPRTEAVLADALGAVRAAADEAMTAVVGELAALCEDLDVTGPDRIVVLDRGEHGDVADWVFRLVCAGSSGVVHLHPDRVTDVDEPVGGWTVEEQAERARVLVACARGRALLDALRQVTAAGSAATSLADMPRLVSSALVVDVDTVTVVAYRYLADAPGFGARAPDAVYLTGLTRAELAQSLSDVDPDLFATSDGPLLLEQTPVAGPVARVSELLHRYRVTAPPAGCGEL